MKYLRVSDLSPGTKFIWKDLLTEDVLSGDNAVDGRTVFMKIQPRRRQDGLNAFSYVNLNNGHLCSKMYNHHEVIVIRNHDSH